MRVQIAQLKLLGAFGLTDAAGKPCSVSSRKNRALLAILALSRNNAATREQLCGLLWGDRGEEQARSSLRQCLAVMRRELGHSAVWLKTEDDRIALDPNALSIDVLEFYSCVRSDDLDKLTRAAVLHQGQLLADVSLREESFEQWLAAERRHLVDAAILGFERLALSGPPAARIDFAKRLVELDPFREASQRCLIGAYHAAGEKGLALQQYEECKKLLMLEFGVSPAAETQHLRQLITTNKGDTREPQQSTGTDKNSLPTERPAIAVLPFTNLSGDPEQQYFADGVSEDILTALTRFKSLSVVARNSAFRYRGDVDVSDTGRALGAHFVVAGSIRRMGTGLRISAQLRETKSAKQIWAETFNAPETDLFKIQDELVQTIAGTLVGRVADASVYHARLKPPASLAAYELLLRANSLDWEASHSKADARRLLEQAVNLDPEYATAYALLAALGLREAAYQSKFTPHMVEPIIANARKAVEIDPNDSACHSILGRVLIACKDCDLAEEHITRALQLNPNNPFAMFNYGSLLVQLGKPAEAIEWFTKAVRTDPYFSPSWVQEKFALAHFTARDYVAAASHVARASKLRFHMSAIAAATLHKLGKLDAAKLALERALGDRPDLNVDIMQSIVPYSRVEDEDHLRQSLLTAGIPDRR